MKTNTLIILMTLVIVVLVACNSKKADESANTKTEQKVADTSNATAETKLSIEEIDKIRAEVEALDIKPTELSTSDLREKIKQKWSKIHFYVSNDVIVKIKHTLIRRLPKEQKSFMLIRMGWY